MGQWKSYFEMTRRQRRGTIVVLVVIALLLALMAVLRTVKTDAVDPVAGIELQQPDSAADSAAVKDISPQRSHKSKASGKHRRHPAKKTKPNRQPHRLDPVPQF